jgi:hypothetical protein
MPLLGINHRAAFSYSLYFSDGSMIGLLPLMTILCEFFLVIGGRGIVNLIITLLIVHPFQKRVYRAKTATFNALAPFLHITQLIPTILKGNVDGVPFLKSLADYSAGVRLAVKWALDEFILPIHRHLNSPSSFVWL